MDERQDGCRMDKRKQRHSDGRLDKTGKQLQGEIRSRMWTWQSALGSEWRCNVLRSCPCQCCGGVRRSTARPGRALARAIQLPGRRQFQHLLDPMKSAPKREYDKAAILEGVISPAQLTSPTRLP